jgi:His/Glu/Gln/Arg/opine family amino acid ABC transporter permease subunit
VDRFDISLIIQYSPLLGEGLWMTLRIVVVSFILGYALGLAIALVSLLPGRLPRFLMTAYGVVLRSVPFIIVLFVVYYGLPFWRIRLPAFVVGTIALAVFNSAYYAEIIWATIVAVPKGQFESAKAVGMSPAQTMRYIIAPQILRALVPPSTSMTLTMIKESSVLSSITVSELTYQGLVMQGNTYAPIECFVAVGGIYWLLCASVAWIARSVELRVGVAQEANILRSKLAASFLSIGRPRS